MKKTIVLTVLLALTALCGQADVVPEWRNPQVNQQNREARRSNFFAFENEQLARVGHLNTFALFIHKHNL